MTLIFSEFINYCYGAATVITRPGRQEPSYATANKA